MCACRLIFTSIKRLLGGRGGCIRSEGEIWTHEKETALNGPGGAHLSVTGFHSDADNLLNVITAQKQLLGWMIHNG